MRITKVYIKEYKNLYDFNWELEDTPISVIVGKNASGKTNLLAALVEIFIYALHYVQGKSSKSSFDFSISYVKEDNVLITFKDKFSLYQNDNPTQAIQDSTALPEKIFAYYAGESKTISKLIIENKAFDLFAYLFPQDNHFLLLSMFGSRLERIKENILHKQFGIKELISFDIVIQNPYSKKIDNPSISNFFGAPPDLTIFFQKLKDISQTSRGNVVFRNGQLTLTIGKDKFDTLMENMYEYDLYQTFQRCSSLGFIRKIDQFQFIKEGVENPIGYEDLSEGERQRLGLLGAFAVYQGKETLFLLDEPDAFAHPRWQWDFVPDLYDAIGHTASQQVIFTTHSPIVLSSLSNPAYKIQNGTISKMNATFGNTVDETLAEQEVPYREGEVADKLKIYLALIQEGEAQSDEAKEIRLFLENKLGENHQELKGADDLIFLYE
jgi:AAA15 family ATPase/GTPase